MRQPPTAFQKMRHRRAQIAEQQKRQELGRLAHNVAAAQRQCQTLATADVPRCEQAHPTTAP